MSYPGANFSTQGPFLQGLTTSNLQDTWSSDLVSYASNNNVATLNSDLKGDWRVVPSYTTGNSSAGRTRSMRPFSTAGAHYAYHSNISNWNAGYRIAGDESVIAPNSSSCGFYVHGNSGSGPLNLTANSCTTLCELLP